MRTTASYDLFPDAPSERAIARARWLARVGRVADAEAAYRGILAATPDLKACWAECFELLRSQNRTEDALRLAEAALGHFGESAFPYTLKGAALIELRRYREALQALEHALERDPDLGLAWHELGYAAYRLGDPNRALLALDRAFALEPHTETLQLRGRILRDSGRYQAAEVAFEAASQTAEHNEQREAAEAELSATRRFAFYSPKRPEELSAHDRWFSETGAIVLAAARASAPPSDETLVHAFLEVTDNCRWKFGQLVVLGPSLAVFNLLADGLQAPLVERGALDPHAVPLVAALRPLSSDAGWNAAAAQVAEHGAGLVFTLEHAAESTAQADVVGVLLENGVRASRAPDTAHALSLAQHPAARLASRKLGG
ncbi:MAG TPA: tetratricopeptide repeat protein [Gemmatimonadales bacterium]|nr:tetratricopeptide repeat protein [Gemmatimonadales bacterium]